MATQRWAGCCRSRVSLLVSLLVGFGCGSGATSSPDASSSGDGRVSGGDGADSLTGDGRVSGGDGGDSLTGDGRVSGGDSADALTRAETPPRSSSCTDATYVLPLNPSNPQDGVTLGGYYVATDTWNAAGYQVSQTMYICDYDDWYVVANMNDDARDGAVKTYPNVHKDFPAAPKINSFATITSTFAHAGPDVGIYEFAYDIWLNGVATNGSTEVMIWTDNYHQTPSGSRTDTVTVGGHSYDVYRAGSYIAFVDKTRVSSGTVDLLWFFNYIIGKGFIPSTSTVGAIDYGVELVSTGGADARFAVTAFSLTAN